jgi:hypothetical protein
MNLETLTPDIPSKLSFYLIIIIMKILGFIQDFVFNIRTYGILTPFFNFYFYFF